MSDFYQSPSDKIRLEMMLTSLSEGGLNLAILGDDEVALSAYARRIYEHLKTLPDAQVDLCLSADADKLVQRFNQILSELTLDEALDKTQKAPVKRFLIFPDTQAVQDFELQLLARLINGLPASNIHVVLLLNRREPYEKKLQAFGKHLVQWILESEHPSSFANGAALLGEEDNPFKSSKDELVGKGTMSSQALKQQFAQRGFGAESTQAPFGRSEDRQEPVFDEPSSREPSLSEVELIAAIKAAEEKWNSEHRDEKRDAVVSSEDVLPKSSAKSSKLGWGLLFGFLLSVSALAALYQDALLAEAQHMKEYLTGPQWDQGKKEKALGVGSESSAPLKMNDAANADLKSPASSSSSVGAPASVGMSSSTKPAAVKADDSLIPDKEAILTPGRPEVKDNAKADLPKEAAKDNPKEMSKEVSKVPTQRPERDVKPIKPAEPLPKEAPLKIPVLKDPPAIEPLTSAGKIQSVGSPSRETTRETPKENSKPVIPSGLTANEKVATPAWVSSLPAKAWVLQLAAMPTKAEILTLKEETPAFASAQVLLTQNPQSKKPYYILVRGPFASKEVAQNLMNSTPALAKAWLRSAQSLKTQFETQGQ